MTIRRIGLLLTVLTGGLGMAMADPAPADGNILVFGGTGRLGSEVVRALVEDNHAVTVFARPSSQRDRLAGLPVTYLTGDVLVENDVEQAFKAANFKAVVDALARGPAGVDFYRISQQHIAKWAAVTRVDHVILHGSVGAGASWDIYPQQRRERMKDLMVEKTAGETALVESGLPYTIIRNAMLLRHGTPATGKAQLYEGEDKFGAVTRADLGRLTAGCIDNPVCHNKIYHAVDTTLDQIVRSRMNR